MYKKYFMVSIASVFLWLDAVLAQVPAAYRGPGSADEVGLTTILEYDTVRSLGAKLSFTGVYNKSWDKTLENSAREKGRVTIRQYPIDTRDNYPVEIRIDGPESFDVTPKAEKSHLQGPSGFDSRALYAGPWISDFNVSIKYSGNGENPSGYLYYSYPETMNNSATQNYLRSEGFTVGGSATLSPDAGKSGIGVNASYSQTTTIGGSVSTRQMKVERANEGAAGNKWTYTTWVDNSGHNISMPYGIWNNGGDPNSVLNAIPDISKRFTPMVGQFWKIPKEVSQEFDVLIKPSYTFVYGEEWWSWGIYFGPGYYGNKGGVKLTSTPLNKKFILNNRHPSISGLNTFRFRYGNSGKCWTENRDMWLSLKMQNCSSQIATQYFMQDSDFTMESLSTGASGTTDWTMVNNAPVRLYRGNVECASYNGRDCLWGTHITVVDRQKLKPLSCGSQHQAVYGIDGYSDPQHWCTTALSVLEKVPRISVIANSDRPVNKDNTGWIEWEGIVLRLHNGQVQCASYDAVNCLWGDKPSDFGLARLNPLTCGEYHRQFWGTDGYSDPNHWCARALPQLREMANNVLNKDEWFMDRDILLGASLRIHEGNVACYSEDRRVCSTTSSPSDSATTDKLLVCGRYYKGKHGITGYYTAGHWCARAAAKYLPVSIVGESGDLYSRFYFTDNGSIKTLKNDYLVDVVNNVPVVRDLATSGIRGGLWQYLVF